MEGRQHDRRDTDQTAFRTLAAAWYAKYRLPDGRQVQKKLGPAWTERGRLPAGHFTKRTAEDWLRTTLTDARRGTLAGAVLTGATFADAAAEWLRYIEQDRERKPSTLRGYRSIVERQLLPVFGKRPLETVTTDEVEAWVATMHQASSSRIKALVLLHGIYKRGAKVWGLQVNPLPASNGRL